MDDNKETDENPYDKQKVAVKNWLNKSWIKKQDERAGEDLCEKRYKYLAIDTFLGALLSKTVKHDDREEHGISL